MVHFLTARYEYITTYMLLVLLHASFIFPFTFNVPDESIFYVIGILEKNIDICVIFCVSYIYTL